MNVVRWHHFRELDDFFGRTAWPGVGENLANNEWQPAVDIRENENGYIFDIELPSVAPEDVNVSVKDGVLTVSGERSVESSDESGRVHRTERRYGRFARSFRLPENADESAIDATSKHGVISIGVAKREQAKPRAIEVKVH